MLGKLLPIHIDGIKNHRGKMASVSCLGEIWGFGYLPKDYGGCSPTYLEAIAVKETVRAILICMTWALWTVGNYFQTRNLVFQSKMVREAFCSPPSTMFCSRNKVLEIEEGGRRGPPYLQPVLCTLPAFHNSGSRRGWEIYTGSSARDVSSLPSLKKILLDQQVTAAACIFFPQHEASLVPFSYSLVS